MSNHQRNARQRAEQGQGANRTSLNPYPAPSPGMATQHQQQQQPRQRPLMSRATPTRPPQPHPRPQPQHQPEIDLYAHSQYATQAIIEYLLRASLFTADEPLVTRRILAHSARFLASSQHETGHGHGNGPSGCIHVSRKSLLEFYTRFSTLYTTLRGLSLELDRLRALWSQILSCRESVIRMYNLGKPVPVPTTKEPGPPGTACVIMPPRPGSSVVQSAPPPPLIKIKMGSDPSRIRSFLTTQAGWTTSEVDAYFRSTTTVEASFTRVENRFQDAVDAFFVFARGLGGISPEEAQELDLLVNVDTQPGYDLVRLERLERVVFEEVVKEVRGLEIEFWCIGRRCPDWEIRKEGELARRIGEVGMLGERWVVETTTGTVTLETGFSRRDLENWEGVGGDFEIVDLDKEMGTEVDWAAIDGMATMDQREREKELEELEREIATDMEREKEKAEREWFREPGQNRHTRKKEGLPRTQNEKKKEMDRLFAQDVEFMYDDHDCVKGWLARNDSA